MPPKKSDAMSLSLNEKILCSAGAHFYEAKVIEVGTNEEEDEPKYLVHYQGWHKRYDEWINQSDIPEKVKPFSEEALAQAKAEIREAKALLNKKARKRDLDELKESASRASTPSENADGSKAPSTASEKTKNRGTKRKAEDDPAKDPFPKKSDLRLQLPTELKNILIEDCDLINRQAKIYSIPARYTVEMIINDFCQEVGLDRNEQDRVVIEYEDGKALSQDAIQIIQSTRGVQDYFDSLLPYQLLYKLEKLQYSNVIEKEKREVELASNKKRGRSVSKPVPVEVPSGLLPSKFYGFPHLLRLLTRFEYLLKLSVFNDRTSASIMKSVSDFTVWLNKKKDVYHNSQIDYIVPTLEYQREAYA